MSLRLLTLVWDRAPYKDGALLLLLALADFSNDDGVSWPAVETVAHKARMSERHARRLLREFETEGILRTQQRGDLHESNVYAISVEKLEALPKRTICPPSDGGTPASAAGGHGGPDGGTPVSPQPSGTVKEPPSPKKEDEVTLESVAFVEAFIKLLADTGAQITPPTTAARVKWADTYEKLVRLDGKTKGDIWRVCEWARRDGFWKDNFFAPTKLRDKKDGVSYFDRFAAKMKSNGHASTQRPHARSDIANNNLEEFRLFDQRMAAGGV